MFAKCKFGCHRRYICVVEAIVCRGRRIYDVKGAVKDELCAIRRRCICLPWKVDMYCERQI